MNTSGSELLSQPGYVPDWPAPAGVRSWQSTRSGGVSRGDYSSFNLALHVGDSDLHVAENRQRLARALDLPAEPSWLEQVHGHRILDFDRGDSGAADGAVTSKPGVVLAIMTADCLPVLLASKNGQRIAVAHAGWRGLASGVIGNAVRALGGEPGDLVAWLGPAIAQPAFEVGDEVRAAFVDRDPALAAAFESNPRGRWQADLFALARSALERSGVHRVHGDVTCTYTEAETYFSHRRQAPCGRMATLIWRDF